MKLRFWQWLYSAFEKASLWVYYNKIATKEEQAKNLENVIFLNQSPVAELKYYYHNSQTGQMTEMGTNPYFGKYDA